MASKLTQLLMNLLFFFAFITFLQYVNFSKSITINFINIALILLFSENYRINYNRVYKLHDIIILSFITRGIAFIMYKYRFT